MADLAVVCSTVVASIAGVRVSEENCILIQARISGPQPAKASIAVGPEGTCACKITTGNTHVAATTTDAESFENVLKNPRAEVGVRGQPARA